jgi:hypothetical protein
MLPPLVSSVGWVALVLSVLSFFTFVGLVAAETIRLLWQRGGPERETRGGEEGWAKVGEAIAKIIDSLGKAGPAISALVASIAFMVIALMAARWAVQKPPPESPVPTRSAVIAPQRCVVSGFPDGDHHLRDSGQPNALSNLVEAPAGCVDQLIASGLRDELVTVFFIGRVDKRELRPEVQRVYGSNLALAYQRALALKSHVVARYRREAEGDGSKMRDVDTKLIPLSAGPSHVEGPLSQEQRASDRCVEIVAYLLPSSAVR